MAIDPPLPRARSAVLWSSVAYAGRVGTQFATLVLLSRLLPPSDFGIMAMAAVITGLATVIRDLGAGPAVVRAPQPTRSFLASQFVVAAGFGFLLGLAIFLIAPIAAVAFDTAAVSPLLQVLAVSFLIGGLGVVPLALLERRYAFRAIAIAEILAGGIGLAVAIAAAQLGAGPLAFGVQVVSQTLVAVIALAVAARWRPDAAPSARDIRTGLRFGAPLAGYSTLNYLARNADNALIGIALGPAALGFYSVAYRLMLFPVQVVNSVGNRVLLPMLAGVHHDLDRSRATYLTAVAAASLVGCPIAAGLAGGAEQVVAVLLGPGWGESVLILRVLAVVAVVQVIGATVGPVYVASGQTDRLLGWGIMSSVVTVVAFLVGLPFGIVGVAVAYAVSSALLFIPSMFIGLAPIKLPVTTVLARTSPTVLSAAAGGFAVFLVGLFLAGAPPAVTVVVQVLVLLVIYIGGVALLDRATLRAAREIGAEIAG